MAKTGHFIKWKNKKDFVGDDKWEAIHESECKLNHKNNSGTMGSVGEVEIFNCSISKNGLIIQGCV